MVKPFDHQIIQSIIVVVLPVIKPISVEGQTFAGEAVQLQCFVPRGDTPLSIWWEFDDEDQQATKGASFSTTQLGPRTSLLIISAATAWHSGNYTCHANNMAGETTATVPLTVHGIRSRPGCTACLSPCCVLVIIEIPISEYYRNPF